MCGENRCKINPDHFHPLGENRDPMKAGSVEILLLYPIVIIIQRETMYHFTQI